MSSKRAGLSVEDDWTVFPRCGIVAGSPTDQNSILVKNLEAYRKAVSYTHLDVYKRQDSPYVQGL